MRILNRKLSKSRKKKRSRRSFRKSFFAKIIHPFKQLISFAKRTPVFSSIAVMVLLFSTSTNYYVILEGRHSLEALLFDTSRVAGESALLEQSGARRLQSLVQAPIYLLVLFLGFLNFKSASRILLSVPTLAIIPLYLVITAIPSTDPTRVIMNAILVFIAFLAAAVLAANLHDRQKGLHGLFFVFFLPLFVHQLATVWLFYSLGVSFPEFIEAGKRASGFSNSPNNLANQAVIGIWAATNLIFSRHSSRVLRLLCVVSLAVFVLNILISGSGTGLAVALGVVFVTAVFYSLTRFNASAQVVLGMGATALVLVGSAVTILFLSPGEIFVAATESLGKDATLTGRTDFWEIGLDAVSEKPFLGWGYDGHSSVLSSSRFSIGDMPHFHNGFLDTAIAGGIVLLILVVSVLLKYLKLVAVRWPREEQNYAFLVAFVMVIGLNLTEYQLLRPHSQVWLVFLCVLFFLVARDQNIGQLNDKTDSSEAMRARRSRKRRTRSISW